MKTSKMAAVAGLVLVLMAQAAGANDKSLQVSAIILAKCSTSAQASQLRCTGSDKTHYRVSTESAPVATAARTTTTESVVTVEF